MGELGIWECFWKFASAKKIHVCDGTVTDDAVTQRLQVLQQLPNSRICWKETHPNALYDIAFVYVTFGGRPLCSSISFQYHLAFRFDTNAAAKLSTSGNRHIPRHQDCIVLNHICLKTIGYLFWDIRMVNTEG